MCNLILDGYDNFEVPCDNLDVVLALKPHFLIQTDGGCRSTGVTALGYVIYGVILGFGNSPLDYYTLAGNIFSNLASLESEARALDCALGRLIRFLVSHSRRE